MSATAVKPVPNLATLISALIDGKVELSNELFVPLGAAPPKVIWSPAEGDLDDSRLVDLLRAWTEERDRTGRVPCPDWVEPEVLMSVLGYLMLLEPVDDGRDFRYRLYGTEISRRFMRDLTGHLVSEVPVANSRMFFLSVYQAAMVRREPIFTWHAPPPSVHVTSWSRLILPLCDDDEQVCRFLVGNIPGPWRGPETTTLIMGS